MTDIRQTAIRINELLNEYCQRCYALKAGFCQSCELQHRKPVKGATI